jgi:hypothetical protein
MKAAMRGEIGHAEAVVRREQQRTLRRQLAAVSPAVRKAFRDFALEAEQQPGGTP